LVRRVGGRNAGVKKKDRGKVSFQKKPRTPLTRVNETERREDVGGDVPAINSRRGEKNP